MSPRQRSGRTLFLAYLCCVYVTVLSAAPLMTVGLGEKRLPRSQQALTFEQVDRNKDGLIDKSEAGAVPGLSAHFERADTNKDGKLDKVEFGRGLAILDGRSQRS